MLAVLVVVATAFLERVYVLSKIGDAVGIILNLHFMKFIKW
jgi:hypothetical protein